MGIVVRRIQVEDILCAPNSKEIINAYWRECALTPFGAAKPDLPGYKQMEAAGFLKAVGVFDNEKIVGGAFVLLTKLAHYSKMSAAVESLFVLPEARKKGAGTKLLREIRAIAKEAGAPGVFISAPVGGQLERLGRAAGWQNTNTVFFLENEQ